MNDKGEMSAAADDGARGRGIAEVYGAAAPDYFRAGWQPLPLPPGAKTPPPKGFTGAEGKLIGSIETIRGWSRNPKGARGNVGLHLLHPFVGIDVDTHGEGEAAKVGSTTLARAEAELGALPPTLISSARPDPLVSGIRIYRLPRGSARLTPGAEERLTSRFGPDIDIISQAYRYVVAWPSTNPDADGAPYRWYAQHGDGSIGYPLAGVPTFAEVAELPTAWADLLTSGEPVETRANPVRAQARAQAVEAAQADDELDDLGIDVADAAARLYSRERADEEIAGYLAELRAARRARHRGARGINEVLRDTAAHLYHFVPHFLTEGQYRELLVEAQRQAWIASGGTDDGDYSGALATINRTVREYVPTQVKYGLWWVAADDEDDLDEIDEADGAAEVVRGKAQVSATEQTTERDGADDPTDFDEFEPSASRSPSAGSSTSAASSVAAPRSATDGAADGMADAADVAAMLELRAQRKREKAEKHRAEQLAFEVERQLIRDEAKAIAEKRREEEARAKAAARIDAFREGRVRTLAQMRERPMIPFLTEHWLPAHCVARAFGDSGTYKTFLMIDWAIHLALGKAWHGCEVAGPTRVMWVAGEGEDDIAERIDAWITHHAPTFEERAMLDKNLLVHPGAVQIMDDGEWWDFVALCHADEIGFAVIDTQSTSTVGMDEDENPEINKMLARCRALAQPDGKAIGPAVMLVHHTGYQGGRARGASAGFAGLDVEIEVASPSPMECHFRHQKIKRRAKQTWQALKVVPAGNSLAIAPIDASDKPERADEVKALKDAAARLAAGQTPTTTELFAYVLRRYFHDGEYGGSREQVAGVINDLRGEWGLTKPGGRPFAKLNGRSARIADAVKELIRGEEAATFDDDGNRERLPWVEELTASRLRLTREGCAHFGWPYDGEIPDVTLPSEGSGEGDPAAALRVAKGLEGPSAGTAEGADHGEDTPPWDVADDIEFDL